MCFPFPRVRQPRPVLKAAADFAALALLLWGQSGCRAAPLQEAASHQAASHQAASQAAPATTMTNMTKPQRFLLAHYMAWYSSKEYSGQWGWHWTMNHFKPDRAVGEPTVGKSVRREGASRYYPLIGLYDSGDPDALRCQVMLMKLSGIDGVIIDWYGNEDFYDYAVINRNTQQLIPLLQKAGLRFAVCFEDRSVEQKVAGGRFSAAEAVSHGQRLMEWMQTNFFANPSYLKLDNRPVLLSFGEPYYKDEQWKAVFSVLPTQPLYFTEHVIRAQTAAIGGFDWPVPKNGIEGALQEQRAFYERVGKWPYFVAAAYPRFQDIYAQANVHPSWGNIDDREGRTYTETLTRALQSDAAVVQLITWNDWGEGTQIEPSVEFGFRDLEATQKLRRQHLDSKFSATAPDLRLPVKWYHLKKRYVSDAKLSAKLDSFFPLLVSGRLPAARALLAQYKEN